MQARLRQSKGVFGKFEDCYIRLHAANNACELLVFRSKEEADSGSAPQTVSSCCAADRSARAFIRSFCSPMAATGDFAAKVLFKIGSSVCS